MDIFSFLAGFLYRIRYKLVVGVIIAACLSIYFSSFLPKIYSVSTTLFTGITSKSSIDTNNNSTDWNASNNAHENILNIIRSKSTLEVVSVKLLTQHLMYGDAEKDNQYILAKNYKELLDIVPRHVLDLVDKSSFDSTFNKLMEYRGDGKGNFIYELFNWDNEYYGHIDLNKIRAFRKGASDMIEITYDANDPGIAKNTLVFLNEEIVKEYENLLLGASNDIIRHFEEQLQIVKMRMDSSENVLTAFSVENKIINYNEQTKYLASFNYDFQARYELAQLEYSGNNALVNRLDSQMNMRNLLTLENEKFLRVLAKKSELRGKISEIEIFSADSARNSMMAQYQKDLIDIELQVTDATNSMDKYKFSKEGIVIDNIVNRWLDATMGKEKSGAQLEVLRSMKSEIEDEYGQFSPVGPNLDRMTRDVKVNEQTYLTIHNHLWAARLKQKNKLIDAGIIQVIADPQLPLLVKPRRREIFVVVALIGAMIFIIGFYLLLEMFDRTVRDGRRAELLTGGRVMGVFPTNREAKYRRFGEVYRRMATAQLVNRLNNYITPGKPLLINLTSIDSCEGKSYIASHLSEYWIDKGFNVVTLSHDEDNAFGSKQFLQAKSIYDIPEIASKVQGADVVMVEHSALKNSNIPKLMLDEADVNILVLGAEDIWSSSDSAIFANLNKNITRNNLFLCLNGAGRDAVEQYTGQLPPYTFVRKVAYRMMNFGVVTKD